jgi:hypothetical protein
MLLIMSEWSSAFNVNIYYDVLQNSGERSRSGIKDILILITQDYLSSIHDAVVKHQEICDDENSQLGTSEYKVNQEFLMKSKVHDWFFFATTAAWTRYCNLRQTCVLVFQEDKYWV